MMPMTTKLASIDRYAQLSLSRQTELLGVPRGRCYCEPIPETELNLKIMRLIDEHYLDHPDKGPRRMKSWLARVHDINVNIKRLNRLYYSIMGLQSVLPGPHTSKPAPGHKTYPYLLRGLTIEQPNQVWQTDISYIPMSGGYLYLTAWIDVFSRFVLNWSLSNTMTAEWCTEVYEQTIEKWGLPQIVNTDQGSQYTSEIFSQTVLSNPSVQLSMDGRGRATDNAFIERLWRTVKYEYIYLHDFEDGSALYRGLHAFFDYYNWARDHSSLGPGLPHQFYPTGPKSLS
jgi:putative transposase